MAEIVTPIDVGFAEFMAKLISEVFDSVVSSQAEQEERLAEMASAAAMEPSLFAESYISAEEVDALLARLFPPRAEDADQISSIYVGAPYIAGGDAKTESPPVLVELDLTLQNGTDYRLHRRRRRVELLAAGVARIRSQAALVLAEARQEGLGRLLERGLPRVLVDSGRVNGKLTFQLVQQADAAGDNSAPTGDNSTATGTAFAHLISPDLFKPRLAFASAKILPKARLLVRQADERAPQSGVVSNIFGEVEITFKTVT
jgi:hypothetical protein